MYFFHEISLIFLVDSYHHHSDVGLIVGSIVGAVAIVSLFVFAIAFVCSRRKRHGTKHSYVQVPPKTVQLDTISEKSAPG